MPHAFWSISLCALVLLGSGCAPKGPSLDDALARYDRGLYSTAQQMAAKVAQSTSGTPRDRAAYVAGMAAMGQSGQATAARRWLKQAANSSDATVRGRAQAMLGELDRRQGHWRNAVSHFEKAWPDLDRQQRADTASAAITSLRAAGDVAGVEAWQHRLQGSDTTPSNATWTLQAGAFRSRDGAASHRKTVERMCLRAGLGSPRIHQSTRDGRQLWLVHIGGFSSRSQAESARRSMPGAELLIVRVPL
jgi:hypothetical protein